MKMNQIKELIRHIVNETMNLMQEAHDTGEWWIDEGGTTTYCDNQVVDQGHEYVVREHLIYEVLSHFGIEVDEPEEFDAYEESIKENLIAKGRLDEEELEGWENRGGKYAGPAAVMIKKLMEDKAYPTEDQASDAVFIAYGSSKDARDYAMKYWRWKIMKADSRGDIYIQTWHLKPEDLNAIVRGIWEITNDNDEDPDDVDAQLGKDGYSGPRVNVTVEASGKQFHDVPLAVLEKKVPSSMMNYRSGLPWELAGIDTTKEGISESYHHNHKEYRLYEGGRHIIATFNDGSRLKFEVHFRNNHGEDREKWRHKAFTKWKSTASKLHGDVELSEVGNPMEKSWKECFKEALKDPDMKQYVREKSHQRVFDDKGYPASVQGKPQACIDPVNFTRMG